MLKKIMAILREKFYKVYTRPYELNIIGLRSRHTKANRFDDELHVFYTTAENKWNYHLYKVTTDPGTYWLTNPEFEKGTAILKAGQYVDAYAIGTHRGRTASYTALVQVKPVTVIRDYDRNNTLNLKSSRTETGMFGINIHYAPGTAGTAEYVNGFSAGCQVFARSNDFYEFMHLCEKHRSLYGNSFTYTLIDFRAMRRLIIKRVALALTVVSSLALLYFSTDENDQTDEDS